MDTYLKDEELGKPGKILKRCILLLFGIVMIYITVLVIFGESHIYYAYKKGFLIGNLPLLLFGIFLTIGAMMFLEKKNMEALLKEHTGKKILLVSVLLFFLQIYVCYHSYFGTGWDAGYMMYPNARMIMEGKFQDLSNEYFSKCPNNIFLLFVFSKIMKIDQMIGMLDTAEGLMGLITVQCLLSCITGYLLFQVVLDYTTSYRAAWVAWFFYLILIGTCPWLMIPYSDSFGLVFPIFILRIYQLLKNGRRRQLKWGLIALAAFWGYQMKPQIVLVLISIIVVEGIHFLNKKNKIKLILRSGIWGMLICLLVSGMLYGQVVKQTGLVLDKDRAFGISHYFMLGLNPNTNGAYFTEDVLFSESFTTVKERREANIEKAVERVKEYGLGGMGMHLVKKTLNNFADGTFAWSQEGDFYNTVYGPKNTVVSPLLREILWEGGQYHIYFNTFKQMVWLLILALSIGMVGNKGKKDKVSFTIVTALLGLTLFQLLFEARARYLYTYVPLYIMTATLGLQNWKQWINTVKEKGLGNRRKQISSP